MQAIIRDGSYTWCVNPMAAAYPGFVAQVHDVQDQYARRVGILHSQVAWGLGCQVQHNFVVGLQCGGCAAHVFYANWPVVVEYKADLGFVDWRSTTGHEDGHALLGLHEQYDDVAFRCLTDRTWTVMSCGTGVRYPQGFDVLNGCQALNTPWCGPPPLPPCGEPCWDGSLWLFSTGWAYEPLTDNWIDPLGRLFWEAKASWGGRWSPVLGAWLYSGTPYLRGDLEVWNQVP